MLQNIDSRGVGIQKIGLIRRKHILLWQQSGILCFAKEYLKINSKNTLQNMYFTDALFVKTVYPLISSTTYLLNIKVRLMSLVKYSMSLIQGLTPSFNLYLEIGNIHYNHNRNEFILWPKSRNLKYSLLSIQTSIWH